MNNRLTRIDSRSALVEKDLMSVESYIKFYIPPLRKAQRRLHTSLHDAFRHFLLKNKNPDIEMQVTDEEDIE